MPLNEELEAYDHGWRAETIEIGEDMGADRRSYEELFSEMDET